MTGSSTLGAVYYDGADTQAHLRHLYEFEPVSATGVRIFVTGRGRTSNLIIDEIELYSPIPQGTLITIQ